MFRLGQRAPLITNNLPKCVGFLNVRWGLRVIGTCQLMQLVRYCQAGSLCLTLYLTVAVSYWLAIITSKIALRVSGNSVGPFLLKTMHMIILSSILVSSWKSLMLVPGPLLFPL